MKQLKDYLHLYLGCEGIGYYKTKDGSTGDEVIVELRKALVGISIDDFTLTGNLNVAEFRPILRPLSDMTEDDFYLFTTQGNKNDYVCAKVNGYWCVAEREPDDDELHIDDKERIYRAEENDYDNVLSYCPKSRSLAYGTSDEMRYFVEPKVYAEWHRYLLSKHFDLFDLIQAGLAIDATTLK